MMENGIGVVVDERRLGDGVSGFRVGAHVTKDSEGDDFFEAATEENLMAETPRAVVEVDSGVGGDSGHDFGGDGLDNVGHEESETFEEAIGVSGEVRDIGEVKKDEKIVYFGGKEGFDDGALVSDASVKEGGVENVEVTNAEGGNGEKIVYFGGREGFDDEVSVLDASAKEGGVEDVEVGNVEGGNGEKIVYFGGREGFDDEVSVSVSDACAKEGVVENVEVGNVKDGGNGEAILGVADDGEMVSLNGDEVGEKKFDGSVENLENGKLDDANVEDSRGKLENVDVDKGGEEGIHERGHQDGESNGQLLDQEDTIEEENETFVDLDTRNEDGTSEDHPMEASALKIGDEWTRELQEILAELGKGHENVPNEEAKDALPVANSESQNENEELGNVSAGVNFEHRDDGADEVKSASSSFGTECQDGDSEILEGGSINVDSVSRDDTGGEVKESMDVSGKEAQNKGNYETRGTSVSLESYTSADEETVASNLKGSSPLDDSITENENGNRETRDTSVSLESYVSADEGTVASNIETPPPLEDFTSENERITPITSQLGAEDKSVSQQHRADENENIDEVHHDHSLSVEPEKLEIKEKQRVEHIVNRGMNPASEVASSSAKSTNLTPPPAHPAGLGRGAPLLEPASRVVQARANGNVSQTQSQLVDDSMNGEAEENDETREKLQMIRVKFLRLAHRLGQTPHNVVVAQVLYRLGLAEQLRGRTGGRVGAFSFDRASAMAEQLEAAGQEPLDFSCTIMVLGKTGVGKSATINSIFDEVRFGTDAFQLGTKKVQDVVGLVQGIKVRVIDTPGLLTSWSDQCHNEKILQSVKRFIRKTPPDIVLYLDRLDMQSRDFSDMPLLRTITETFGPSIWFNAIVVLTHAASAPPDGPNGTASSYDMFVTQRSHVVQQAIRHAAGDMRLMNPVSLVENHSACRTNRAGQRVLPNGQVWKPHLLLLSFASKILAEANTLLKLQDSPPGKPSTARPRAPPLPFLLSSLLQSRPQLKLPEEQFGDEDTADEDLDESSDSDEESEYDELPPFKRLMKDEVAKLTRDQRRAYFDELEYREKLFMKKQLKEERRRRRMMKKMADLAKDMPSEYSENVEEESGAAASVPVPMPDLSLPASFDSDNPTHRYRYLDSANQWLVRPVLETHGWDHDVGYEGINVEKLFVVKEKIPLSFSGQVSKDKKESNLQMEIASSVKHGEGKATSLGFDMQTVGKDIAYTLRSETRLTNYRKNKATAGISATLLGDALTAGVKFEDKLIVNKRFRMVVTGGAMTGRGDVAYGGSLEATLRDKDHPLGRSLSTLGLSVMDWHGDLAIGCNIQSQIPIGRSTNMIARANLNNRGAGQVSIRLNSSEQLQIALIGLLPLLRKLFGYPQQMQYGQ